MWPWGARSAWGSWSNRDAPRGGDLEGGDIWVLGQHLHLMVVVVGGGQMVSEVVGGRGVAGTRPGGVFCHCVPDPRPSDPQRRRFVA